MGFSAPTYFQTLVVVGLAACGPMTPEERGIKVNEDIIGVYNQDKAMFTAQYLVEDYYGVELGDLWTDAVVYWTDTKCPKNGQYAVIYDRECYYGIMWSCDEIYVALSNGDPETTTGSALLHEFGHCMHMEMGLGGDTNHVDNEFWDVIIEAQDIARGRGW